ncbi:MAG: YdcF family protein [Acidimicrobiia bacterium]
MRWARIAWRALLLAAVIAVGYFLVTFVQVWRSSRADHRRPSQAIVVLGAAQYDGRPSAVLRARLDHAADLYRAGIAPTVVVTGGKVPGDRYTEATVGADYLHSRGVPDSAILRETTSRSSWESLEAASRFLRAQHRTRVTLVSDPFHSLRIELIARELGLDPVTSPTRTSPIRGLAEWRRFFTETLRVMAGRVIGWGRLARRVRR